MIIKKEKPPLWDEIVKKFGVKETDPVFYTYGDIIFSPSGIMPSEDLMAHEFVHAEQQMVEGPELWWRRHLHDPEWRLEQEAEAYGAQYKFLCQKYKDRNKRNSILHQLAGFLSSPLYGSVTTRSDAMELIRGYADPSSISQRKAV